MAQLGELSDSKPLDSENVEDVAQSVWHWPETAPVLKRETISQNQPAPNVPQSSSENGTQTDSEPSNKPNIGTGPKPNEYEIPPIKEFPNPPNAVSKGQPEQGLGKPAASQPPLSNEGVENVIQPIQRVLINAANISQANEPIVPPPIKSSPEVVIESKNGSEAADPNNNSNLPPSTITPWYVASQSPGLQQTSTGNTSSSTIVQPVLYLSLSCYLISQFLL